jgi:hypothetical protein
LARFAVGGLLCRKRVDCFPVLSWIDPCFCQESLFDFHRLMVSEGHEAKLLKCSEFGRAIVDNMG